MKKRLLFIITSVIFLSFKNNAQTELWGMSSEGGQYNLGVIYKTDGFGNSQTVVHSFFLAEGANPYYTQLIQAADGKLYGMTSTGGSANKGILFQYDPVDNSYTKRADFTGTANGSNPYGSLMEANDGKLYGLARSGGSANKGVLFQFDPVTNIMATKIDFTGTVNGAQPNGALIQASDGLLYGMTSQGGTANGGVLFKYDISTGLLTKLTDFTGMANGSSPSGSLIQAADGKLYGMAYGGGANYYGVLFSYDCSTTTFTKIYDLTGAGSGSYPLGSLMEASDGTLYGTCSTGGIYGYGTVFQYNSTTSTFVKKADFSGAANGKTPCGSLIQATDGNLFGMTQTGGANNYGVLFQINPASSIFTKKLDFDFYTIGSSPYGSLMQASDGMLYGMTYSGSSSGYGSLFQFDPVTSAFLKKVDFNEGTFGTTPCGSLLKASDGMLYGMTKTGGLYNRGVIFQFDPVTNIYSKKFDFNDTAVGNTPFGTLIQASDGNLYGMTFGGGVNSRGILFQFDPSTNTFNKKADFGGSAGESPEGKLLQATDGMLYGMAQLGGVNDYGVVFKYDITTSTLTTLHVFNPTVDGQAPHGSFLQATDGNLYGMTSYGGTSSLGIIFRYNTTTNTFATVYNFLGGSGDYPDGELIQATNGKLYGLTRQGGPTNRGVIFKFDYVTGIYNQLYSFSGSTDGLDPWGSLIQASNGNLYGMTNLGGVNMKGILFQFNPTTNTYSKKLDFNSTNGARPQFSNLIELPAPPAGIQTNNARRLEMKLYPNPATNLLIIELPEELMNKKEINKIRIVNISGEVVLEEIAHENRMQLETGKLNRGLYFIEISTNGAKLTSAKFIKD